MKLHQNPTLFQELIIALQAEGKIPAAFIEKDYWLTSILKGLSQHECGTLFVFKGGTSLSKAYGMIERFSEDIDLALVANDLTSNQSRSRMKKVSKDITRHLVEKDLPAVTRKWSRFRKTVYEYPLYSPDIQNSQMTPYLILEINSFGCPNPFQKMPISSYMAQYLDSKGEQGLILEYELEPVFIQVLKPERTLAEKILALARASYHEQPIPQLQSKIRHVYDLYIMMQPKHMGDFVASSELYSLLQLAQADDAGSREFQGEWNAQPLSHALIFQDNDQLWNAFEQTYTRSFAPLVYGALPNLSVLRCSMQALRKRLDEYAHERRR